MGIVSDDNGFMVIANLKQLLFLEQLIKVIVTLLFYK